MNIRNFTGKDILTLPEIWKHDQPYLVISRELFLRKIIMEDNFKPEGFFVAEEADGTVLGFSYAVYRTVPVSPTLPIEPDSGWIAAFCVADKSNFDEVGKALLMASEAYLLAAGKHQISTAFYPQYFAQGFVVDVRPEYEKLFLSLGYSASAVSFSLSLDLSNFSEPESVTASRKRLADDGFYIGELKPEMVYDLFNNSVLATKQSFAQQIKMRLEGFDYGKLRVAEYNGQMLGVAPFGDPGSDAGRFGPFIVDTSFRGRGIGTVLFSDCLAEMKRRNIPRAWMQWVSDSGTAFHIYEKFGFKKEHKFVTFAKTLPSE